MLQNKKIAFFMDVDNLGLTNEDYANIIAQLSGMGKIYYGKIYGAGGRKHEEIYDDAERHNYDTARTMRVKRRGRKDFDSRIFVDVVDKIAIAPSLDAVCIIAEPTDMVYLYGYIHSKGVSVIALDNVDEASRELIDEFIELDKAVPHKSEKKPQPKPAASQKTAPAPKAVEQPKAAEPAKPSAPKTDVDRTEELLKEIERLRANASDEDKAVAEPVVEEPVVEKQPEPAPAPKAEPVKEPAKPHPQYASPSDGDLVRRIEELRRNNEGGDSDDLLEQIKKLLDTVD